MGMHPMLERLIGEEGYIVRDNEKILAQGKVMPDLVSNLKKYVAENRNIGIYYGDSSRKDLPEQVSSAEIENFRSLYFS